MVMQTQTSDDGNSSAPQVESGAPASSTGLFDTLLELGGKLTLRDTLAAWQQEQDRLLNRSWRRPGGLARPAGL